MTRNRLSLALIALLALLCVGVGEASDSVAVGHVGSGAPGDVVTLNLTVQGSGTLRVAPDPALILLGTIANPDRPEARVATVLIRMDATAGVHPVSVRLLRNGQTVASAVAKVVVTQVARLGVRVTTPTLVLTGGHTDIPITVSNEGNGIDTIRLLATGDDSPTLDVSSVTLDPGASRTVTLAVTPLAFGKRIVRFEATSAFNPKVRRVILVQYTALAFGAQSPDAPSLNYALPLGASYGSDGFSYFGRFRLNGTLSSIVTTTDTFAVAPSGQSAAVSAFGNDWSVLYGYDSVAGHDLTLSYKAFDLSASLSNSGRLTTGVGYDRGPWSTSFSHTWGSLATDNFSVSYSGNVFSRMAYGVSVGIVGEVHQDGYYHVFPEFGLSALWGGRIAIISAAGRYAPGSRSPWSVSASGYSRQERPIAVQARFQASPDQLLGSLGVTETPSESITLSQQLDYQDHGSYGGQFGVQYAIPGTPLTLVGIASSNVSVGQWTASFNASANVVQLPWIATASATIGPSSSTSYGMSYLGRNFAVGGSISLPLKAPLEPLVGLRGAYTTGGVTVGAGSSYDFADSAVGVSGNLGVQVLSNLALDGTVGYDSVGGITWKVGAKATVFGGFAVPTPIVNAFGGLDVGTVTGIVTVKTHSGTSPASGVEIAIEGANRVTKTDARGRYSITVPPGTYTLTFPSLPPQFNVPTNTSVSVARQATVRRDLELDQTYAIFGQVYVDVDHAGKPTPNSYGYRGAIVQLTPKGGKAATTTTDQTGAFVFRNLHPGRFTVSVEATGIPDKLKVPAKPVEVTLDQSGLASVYIGLSPVPPTVTNTLGTTSLALQVDVLPKQAPPTAIVHVTAHAPSATSVTAAVGNGASSALVDNGGGDFEGDVQLPSTAAGVAVVDVEAKGHGRSAHQTVLVFVSRGPLATISLQPNYAHPGDEVAIMVTLLTEPNHLLLQVGKMSVPLHKTGLRQFSGTLTVPNTSAGTLPMTLSAGGKILARATLGILGH